jgi:PAS domain S-box-containing protein
LRRDAALTGWALAAKLWAVLDVAVRRSDAHASSKVPQSCCASWIHRCSRIVCLLFQETGVKDEKAPSTGTHADVQVLEAELHTAKSQLRSTIDELETSNEEMKSANEEFQSVNEELQSSNEELETAKEEMQSVNEELQTINAEMSSKNEMLTRLNSDLRNLLDSTQFATIFLDSRLHIKYFTPPMTDLFHLRDSDRERPITDLAARMQYTNLRQDVAKVLRDLSVVEREVRIDAKDTVFLMRIRPYRTIDNLIDGVVITFVDITANKRHEQMSAQLAAIVESSQDAIIGHSFDGTISSWNAGAEAIFGYSASEAIGQPFAVLVPQDHADEVPPILEKLRNGERIEHFQIERQRKDGTRIDVSLTISPVRDASGKVIAASTIARDFSERKRAEDHRNLLMAELDHRVKNILMVVSSLVSQTLRGTGSATDFAEEIQGRVQAWSRVHNLLNVHGHTYADLRHVVEGELGIYGGNQLSDIRRLEKLFGSEPCTAPMAITAIVFEQACEFSRIGEACEAALGASLGPGQLFGGLSLCPWSKPTGIVEQGSADIDYAGCAAGGEQPALAPGAVPMLVVLPFGMRSADHGVARDHREGRILDHDRRRERTGRHALAAAAMAGHFHDRWRVDAKAHAAATAAALQGQLWRGTTCDGIGTSLIIAGRHRAPRSYEMFGNLSMSLSNVIGYSRTRTPVAL